MERKDSPNQIPENSSAEGAAQEASGSRRFQWHRRVAAFLKKTVSAANSMIGWTRNAYLRIFRTEGEAGIFEDIKGAFRHIPLRKKGLGYLVAGMVLVTYLLSGVYTVKPGEVAVSRVFGKEVRQSITEGLHYRLPWPFEAVEKVNVMEIRRVDLGVPVSDRPFLFPKAKPAQSAPNMGGHAGHDMPSKPVESVDPAVSSAESQFFTGDENILEIRMIIQYQIKDASDYFFKVNSPETQVASVARAAVTEILGQMHVDDLLTVAKSSIQKRIAHNMQSMLDQYGTGLFIVSANLQEVNPPKEVAQAFRDVASAREEREEKINKAQGYWNSVIPEARGEAHQLISDAEGYQEKIINQARGDAEKFLAMLDEYRKAKDVTEYRLYLETMEKILSKTNMFVVDSKKEQVNLKFAK